MVFFLLSFYMYEFLLLLLGDSMNHARKSTTNITFKIKIFYYHLMYSGTDNQAIKLHDISEAKKEVRKVKTKR